MERRRLGGLNVSVMGLGCNQLGSSCDDRESEAIVHRALDLGINFFDTAEEYGDGESERVLGKALRGRRDEAVIATKFAGAVGGVRSSGRASAEEIRLSVDGSLRRLGTDRIDLYQLHFPDVATPLDETMQALSELVRAGKVREIGCCNFTAGQIDHAAARSAAKRLVPFVSAQNRLNLLRQEALDDIVPACRQHDMAFIPFFPLAAGLLTGKYRRGEAPPPDSRLGGRFVKPDTAQRVLAPEALERVDALAAFAAEYDRTVGELALAWLIAQPAVASVIAGASRSDQVDANVRAANWSLSVEEGIAASRIAASGRRAKPE